MSHHPQKQKNNGPKYLGLYPVTGSNANEISKNIQEKSGLDFQPTIKPVIPKESIGAMQIDGKYISSIFRNIKNFDNQLIISQIDPGFCQRSFSSIKELDLLKDETTLDLSELEDKLNHNINIDQFLGTILFSVSVILKDRRDQIQTVIFDNNGIKYPASFYPTCKLFRNIQNVSIKGNPVRNPSLGKKGINIISDDDQNNDSKPRNKQNRENRNDENEDDENVDNENNENENNDENKKNKKKYNEDQEHKKNEDETNQKFNNQNDDFDEYEEKRVTKPGNDNANTTFYRPPSYDLPPPFPSLNKRFQTVIDNQKQNQYFKDMITTLFNSNSDIGATLYAPTATFSYTISDDVASSNTPFFNFLKTNERNLINSTNTNHRWIGANFFFKFFPKGMMSASEENINILPTSMIGSQLFAVVAHIRLTFIEPNENGSETSINSIHTFTIQFNGNFSQILSHQIFFY